MTKPMVAMLAGILVLVGCSAPQAAPVQPAQTVARHPVPQPPVHFKGFERIGLTDAFRLEEGRREISGWHDGNDFFVVWLTDTHGDRLRRIFAHKGDDESRYTFIAEAGTYYFEIDSADGEWELTIK